MIRNVLASAVRPALHAVSTRFTRPVSAGEFDVHFDRFL